MSPSERLVRDIEDIEDGEGRRALVVTANVEEELLVREQLEALGYDLEASRESRVALDAIERKNFDIILLDPTSWSPADRSLLWLLADGENSSVVVVAPVADRCSVLARQVGMECIARPIDPRELVVTVSRCVRRAALAAAENVSAGAEESDAADETVRTLASTADPGSIELDYSSVDEVLRDEDLDDLIEEAESAASGELAGTEAVGGVAEPGASASSELDASVPVAPALGVERGRATDEDFPELRARDGSVPSDEASSGTPRGASLDAGTRWRRFVADARRRVHRGTPGSPLAAPVGFGPVPRDTVPREADGSGVADRFRAERTAAFLAAVREHFLPSGALIAEFTKDGLRIACDRDPAIADDLAAGGSGRAWTALIAAIFSRDPQPELLRCRALRGGRLVGIFVARSPEVARLTPSQIDELETLLGEVVFA
jgi:DNA-binding response OmpR family regulator